MHILAFFGSYFGYIVWSASFTTVYATQEFTFKYWLVSSHDIWRLLVEADGFAALC